MAAGRIITPDDIEYLSKRIGPNKVQQMLRVMGKNAEVLEALSSETGRTMLDAVVKRLDRALERLISGELVPWSDEDNLLRAEIRVCRSITSEWTNVLREYNGAKNDFDKALGR